jgi:hypothetical protein
MAVALDMYIFCYGELYFFRFCKITTPLIQSQFSSNLTAHYDKFYVLITNLGPSAKWEGGAMKLTERPMLWHIGWTNMNEI